MRKNTRITTVALLVAAGGGALLGAGTSAAEQDTRGGSICGTIWRDTNEDGKRDAGEPVIPNSTIGIVGGNGAYTNSDAEGEYCLTGLVDGDYRLQANDRALFDPAEGMTVAGDNKFAFTTSVTAPITVSGGAAVTGIDAGYRVAKMDVKATQLLMEVAGRTYDSTSPEWPGLRQVGEELTLVGGVVPNGNVVEQLGAELTVPDGLTITGTVGGMKSHVNGQTVTGYFEQRRYPGAVEFVGVKVRVDKPFSPAKVTLRAKRGVYADSDPTNNVITAEVMGIAPEGHPADRVATKDAAKPAAQPAAKDAAVKGDVKQAALTKPAAEAAKTAAPTALASTGADPALPIGIGAGLLALGGAALWIARRRTGSES